MDINELNVILEKHKKWLIYEEGNERINLSKANLPGANLFWTNLSRANLSEANLTKATLSWADLSEADLSGTDLTWANLSEANLSGANLSGANLSGANLSGADLSGAILDNVRWDAFTAFYSIVCPEEGAFIGWKKAHDKIVKLRITEDAKRSSATSRKCRCSKAEVLEIQNIDGSISDLKAVPSDKDNSFLYTVGEIVEVSDFDDDRWNECSQGIHFFITRQEAVNY